MALADRSVHVPAATISACWCTIPTSGQTALDRRAGGSADPRRDRAHRLEADADPDHASPRRPCRGQSGAEGALRPEDHRPEGRGGQDPRHRRDGGGRLDASSSAAQHGRGHRDARPHAGHVSYHLPDASVAFTADTLFALGCGRLFEGTPPVMYESLQKLAALPADDRDLLRPRIHAGQCALRADRRPDQLGAEGARREDRGAARRRQADPADDDRRGTGDQSVPALARPGDPQESRHGDGVRRRGVRRDPQAQGQLLRHAGQPPPGSSRRSACERHPEGGWYAETFRDDADGGRGHSTAIYFLLEAGRRLGLAPGQGCRRGLAPLCRRAARADHLRRGRQARAVTGSAPILRRRAAAGRRAGRLVADGEEPRGVDARRLHRGAGLRFRRSSNWPKPAGNPDCGAQPCVAGWTGRRNSIDFAASTAPAVMSRQAARSRRLGSAKPKAISTSVDSSGAA